MIVNSSLGDLDETQRLIEELRNTTAYAFYLTGSRFFGTSHDRSDWDFYTEDTAGVREWLNSRGIFSIAPMPAYEDGNTNAVYGNTNAELHVQLVADVDLKTKVQEVLLETHLLCLSAIRGDKELGSVIWKSMFMLAKELMR